MTEGSPEDMIRQVEEFLRQAAQQDPDTAGALWEPEPASRPELRLPALKDPQLFRVRIVLNGSDPAIWRQLNVRSDLTLDQVHQAVQCAFYWVDYHLHKFAVGGVPSSNSSQHFLCSFDIEEGDQGVPDTEVELSETMQTPGETLHYLYDYGDNWHLTITLEKVLPLPEDAPWAECVDGRRAAPPEDSRGATEAEVLHLVGDLEAFDADEINRMLQDEDPDRAPRPLPPWVEQVLQHVSTPEVYLQIKSRIRDLHDYPHPDLTPEDRSTALHPFSWFLDQAEQGKLQLTQAGFLKPAIVQRASEVLPTAQLWVGKKNREDQTLPVLRLRQNLQRMGLLRKYKGELKLTKKGRAANQSAESLWAALAQELITAAPAEFDFDLSVLELLEIATQEQGRISTQFLLSGLNASGWYTEGHRPVTVESLWSARERPSLLLHELGTAAENRRMPAFSSAARAFARDALLAD